MKEMINYVYTGDFTGADLNVEMVAWLADKYDLPGMMDLLCFRMKEDVVGPEIIADILIAAGKKTSIFLVGKIQYFILHRKTRLRCPEADCRGQTGNNKEQQGNTPRPRLQGEVGSGLPH